MEFLRHACGEGLLRQRFQRKSPMAPRDDFVALASNLQKCAVYIIGRLAVALLHVCCASKDDSRYMYEFKFDHRLGLKYKTSSVGISIPLRLAATPMQSRSTISTQRAK